jgi:hypothetical protein
MLSQFRTAGAAFLDGYSRTQIYFASQHCGMPTRLVDWSTNPLAALFFACDGEPDQDGFVFAMNAKYIIPEGAMRTAGETLYQQVMTMHHGVADIRRFSGAVEGNGAEGRSHSVEADPLRA